MLSEALSEMKKGKPFNISFWTADHSRDKGGEIKEFKGVVQTSMNYPHAIRKVLLPNGQYKDLHIYLLRTFNDKRICI